MAVVIHAVKKAIYHGDSSLKKSWLKEVKGASYFIKKGKNIRPLKFRMPT